MKKLFLVTALCLSMSTACMAQEPDFSELVSQLSSPTQEKSDSRDIYINGDISEGVAIGVRKELNRLNESGPGDITIHITSFGGDVYSGLQIYDYIIESKDHVVTSCEGYCMSMASILLMAGDVRKSSASATILVHTVISSAQGHIAAMQAEIDESKRLQSVIDSHIHDRTGQPMDVIQKMEAYDHFMGGEEAKKLNIIDKIVGKRGK